MNKTGIEYLTHTWNPTTGRSEISDGCKNCWAKKMAKRLAAMGAPGYDPADPFKVTAHINRFDQPRLVKKLSVIGVSFMGDLFHNLIDDGTLASVFHVMRVCTQHTFVVLTKRPENMFRFIDDYEAFNFGVSPNIWLGVTVENQEQADKRIPILLKTPAAKRWVSVEPCLGPIDLFKAGALSAGKTYPTNFISSPKRFPLQPLRRG